MPGKKVCNKILDPVEREKCLQYKGKYVKFGGLSSKPNSPKNKKY